LFYRLNVISVPLPPLRERQEDILDLAVYFLKSASARAGKRIAQFDDDALNALIQYSWPGNIRELQNVIERAVVLAERETIELADLPHDIQNFASTARVLGQNMTEQDVMELQPVSTSEWLDVDPSAERKQLIDALRQCNGNKTKAARRLGLPRSTYFSKLKKYGIMGDESNDPPRYGRLPR
jgi:DNA-binding NtrC family response regulator